MARLARVVAFGAAHFTTQRGDRRQRMFSAEWDYETYVELIAEWCAERGG
jgi:putative transposase